MLWQGGSGSESPRVYHVTMFGGDPTGKEDSTAAIEAAMAAAIGGPANGVLMEGIANLGGARIDLQGGHYLVSRPLRFPVARVGNLMVLLLLIIYANYVNYFLFKFANSLLLQIR